jgi:DNA-binding IclR family transcriptional regulator
MQAKVAGLSISAPADRLDENWLAKLQGTANEISTALGYKGATPRLAA